MEQLYLIEVFMDKVSIFVDENETSTANKNLICKVKFGPKVELLIKEDPNSKKDDVIVCDENNNRKFTRTIRAGKSYLFPSYPDTILQILHNFPLEIEVWNDDINEEHNIYVGLGTMYWDTKFYVFLKDTSNVCVLHEPLAIKSTTPLMAECCCGQCGEISFIVRISALGESLITEFLQLMSDPDSFIFATNKAPSKFICRRIEGDDPNFTMVGSLYESATLEDPDVIAAASKKIEVCTELQSCGVGHPGDEDMRCQHTKSDQQAPKKYPIDKIRMGDIRGPCGNPNCKLAHKVKMYIRNLEAYKKEYKIEDKNAEKGKVTKNVCGKCVCKDDKWHRDECPELKTTKLHCKGCGGFSKPGTTCEDLKTNLNNTGVTPTGPSPKASKTDRGPTVNYVVNVTRDQDLMESMFGRDFTTQNVAVSYDFEATCGRGLHQNTGCNRCLKPRTTSAINVTITEKPFDLDNKVSTHSFGEIETFVCNTDTKDSNRSKFLSGVQNTFQIYNCTAIPDDRECKCEPHKPTPPCKSADCECIHNLISERSRKIHKSHCPLYKHKNNCPVTIEEQLTLEDDGEGTETDAEPLPYGLPPIRLRPCPVVGRPCSVPDGYNRMYKIGAMPPQQPSYSSAGKICCSKEFERIKKALADCAKNEKEDDYRCINQFNIDTEKRCCDKENFMFSLMGKDCCGPHKMLIQEKYKFAEKFVPAPPPSAQQPPPAPPK